MSSDSEKVREWLRARLNEGVHATAILKKLEEAAQSPAKPSSDTAQVPSAKASSSQEEFRLFGQRLDPRIDPIGAIIFNVVSESSARRRLARSVASDLQSHSGISAPGEQNSEVKPPQTVRRRVAQTFPRNTKTPLSARLGGGDAQSQLQNQQTISTPVIEDDDDDDNDDDDDYVEILNETPSLRRSKRSRVSTEEQVGAKKKQKRKSA
ncbi:hypothetical protein KCU81_g6270, partial [Aureobasidium melanogenum]|uniref:Uncharacterized protein n=1 Tax=Aureobasidium melanogenum (strain CBS 110374) TaxID=1043003 RepID=A0A074VFL7_AURM1